MRTTHGPQRVDVIYRRVDDDFLDPLAFRPDSMLGVPGLLRRLSRRAASRSPTPSAPAWPTTSRSIRYVPEMIRFYLDRGTGARQRADLSPSPQGGLRLRARASRRAGRQGNPRRRRLRHADRAHRGRRRARGVPRNAILAAPDKYIAQPTLGAIDLPDRSSRAGLAPRHVDLRPYVLSGKDRQSRCRAA